jgi:hypothetical protein
MDRRFFHKLGASRLDRTICSNAGMFGMRYTVGASVGTNPETVDRAKYILIWGSNVITSNLHLWRYILKARSQGAKIVTIEGLSPDGSHPIQKAWVALDVPQCGFCQSGMIMAAAALLKEKPKPTDADIDAAMTNICRCGTYNRVRAAIKAAGQGGVLKSAGLAIQHADGSTS